jgi:hypothetical protein
MISSALLDETVHAGEVWNDGLMNPRISTRIGSITESATLAVDAKAKALKASGRPVIGFGAGEPDFPTPSYIVEAAVTACRDPRYHRYTPAAGLRSCARRSRRRPRATPATRCPPHRFWSPTGASRRCTRRSRRCSIQATRCCCRRRTGHLPESIRLAGWCAVEVPTDERADTWCPSSSSRRPALAHEAAGFQLTRNPTAPFIRPPVSRRSALGAPAELVGHHRRDLRAPGLWRRALRLDAGRGTRACRAMRGGQRGCQDLCDDGVGGRVAARAGRRRQAATNLQSHATSNVSNISQVATITALRG